MLLDSMVCNKCTLHHPVGRLFLTQKLPTGHDSFPINSLGTSSSLPNLPKKPIPTCQCTLFTQTTHYVSEISVTAELCNCTLTSNSSSACFCKFRCKHLTWALDHTSGEIWCSSPITSSCPCFPLLALLCRLWGPSCKVPSLKLDSLN